MYFEIFDNICPAVPLILLRTSQIFFWYPGADPGIYFGGPKPRFPIQS